MSQLGTEALPLRVAIVGSGPSGYYAAEALFKAPISVCVDMYDRLPTPFGLVRGGVAPDHPKIKSVTRVYDKISSTAGFQFIGNVMVGRDVSIAEMRTYYDAVIVTCGAETDNRLGIPGEDLPGSHTATEFVGWYNGHPDYRDREFDLSGESAVVVGQGNVAMDVSRILAKTVDELRETDIAAHALDLLATSKIKEIHLVGRRGPVQAKFTPPEIREIGELSDCDPRVDPDELVLNEASRIELEDKSTQSEQKNYAVLQEFASRTLRGKRREYRIHFLRSPVELQGDGRVERVILEKNRLVGAPFHQSAVGTGEFETMPCHILFRSVGYRGVAMPDLPFEERRGVIPNVAGRIGQNGMAHPGMYVAGWIKRGPSGVIGTNKPDSQETVASLLADLDSLTPCTVRDAAPLIAELTGRGIRAVSYSDWGVIDAAEIARGHAKNKPREKFTRIQEMLDLLK